MKKRVDLNARATYLILLQHHEVEVLEAFGGIVAHAFHERRMADHVTYILIDELVPDGRFLVNVNSSKVSTSTHFMIFSSARRPNPFFSV